MKKLGFTVIEGAIVGVMIVVIGGVIALGFLTVKGCCYVKDNGVKNVAQSVWDGGESD